MRPVLFAVRTLQGKDTLALHCNGAVHGNVNFHAFTPGPWPRGYPSHKVRRHDGFELPAQACQDTASAGC
jgi:hypothetical protein